MQHYYFAALGGHTGAAMAMGFRHSLGLGVPKDCQAAVVYYELAANQAADLIEDQGLAPLNERERLSLDRKAHGYTGRSARGEDEEVVDYYRHAAEKGDVSALVALGQIYFYGARGVERDHARAVGFFRIAAGSGDPVAQANLGHMLVKGMGVPKQDLPGALANFTAAAEAGSASGLNGLGYMYLYGLGVAADADRARKYFKDAAEAVNPEAYYNLGALWVSGVGMRRRNYPTALNFFTMAAQKGHTLAMHKLAQMNLHGVGTARNCDNALHLLKMVAEHGEPVRLLARGFSFWNNEDDQDAALQIYLVASELGFEVAQANAAWLLDHGASLLGGVPEQEQKAIEHEPRGAAETDSASSGATSAGAAGQQVASDSATSPATAADSKSSALGSAEPPSPNLFDDPVGSILEDPLGSLLTVAETLLVEFNLVDSLLPSVASAAGSLASLRLYQLAAEQGNVDARLRIGDFFYYGQGGGALPAASPSSGASPSPAAAAAAGDVAGAGSPAGTGSSSTEVGVGSRVGNGLVAPDYERAAENYKQAGDLKNAQALFNLGFMYQHGVGLERDFHLAKRFFDAAESTHQDAKVRFI